MNHKAAALADVCAPLSCGHVPFRPFGKGWTLLFGGLQTSASLNPIFQNFVLALYRNLR